MPCVIDTQGVALGYENMAFQANLKGRHVRHSKADDLEQHDTTLRK
jgi:hypothetical protein